MNPEHPTTSKEISLDYVREVVSQFKIESIADVELFQDRGNINLHTYTVRDLHGNEYLLQKLNTDVFADPGRVMTSMKDWIDAQAKYLASGKAPEWTVWEPITLIPTSAGKIFLNVSQGLDGSVWRLMGKISNSVTFKSLGEVIEPQARLKLAEEVGRGLALNSDLTSKLSVQEIRPSLPGYRDTRGYLNQFKSVLAGHVESETAINFLPADEELASATQNLYHLHGDIEKLKARKNQADVQELIALVLENQEFAIRIVDAVESGEIRQTAIHGDTKIDNFLFCRRTGKVRSLVDLDTIMPFTWLADWGDMMRSLCNVAGEKETDLSRVTVDADVYEAVTRGFLSTAREITPNEIALMPDAVQIISLELGLRFLTDYLRGDNYFAILPADPEDLNLIRAKVQLRLFQKLVELDTWTRGCIARNSAKISPESSATI